MGSGRESTGRSLICSRVATRKPPSPGEIIGRLFYRERAADGRQRQIPLRSSIIRPRGALIPAEQAQDEGVDQGGGGGGGSGAEALLSRGSTSGIPDWNTPGGEQLTTLLLPLLKLELIGLCLSNTSVLGLFIVPSQCLMEGDVAFTKVLFLYRY